MKISELITELQDFQKEHGDVPVVLCEYEDIYFHEVDRVEFVNEPITKFTEAKKPERQPVCVLWS